jgi:hypothetical protein
MVELSRHVSIGKLCDQRPDPVPLDPIFGDE